MILRLSKMKQVVEKSPPKLEPLVSIASGSGNKILSDKTNNSGGCSENSPFTQQELPGVDSRPGSCNIDFDAIIDCIRLYPKFRSYFSEKLACVRRMQGRIDNPGLRCRGENLKYLIWWRDHYAGQIKNMLDYWLPKNDK